MTTLRFEKVKKEVYNVINEAGVKIGYVAKYNAERKSFWFADIYSEFINGKVLGWHEQESTTFEEVQVRAVEIVQQYSSATEVNYVEYSEEAKVEFKKNDGDVQNIVSDGKVVGYIAKYNGNSKTFWFCDIYPEFVNGRTFDWLQRSADSADEAKAIAIELLEIYS